MVACHVKTRFFASLQFHGRVALLPFGSIDLKSARQPVWSVEPKTLGEHLRKRRGELGLFQREVAAQIGVTPTTVLDWEKGKPPYDRYLPRIIIFLGYDPRPAPRTLGERLHRARGTHGLSGKAAARLLGVDEGTFYRWEQDIWVPRGGRRALVDAFLSESHDPPQAQTNSNGKFRLA